MCVWGGGGVVNVGRGETYGEADVFLVLVDSPGVWDGLCVLDHTHALPCTKSQRK